MRGKAVILGMVATCAWAVAARADITPSLKPGSPTAAGADYRFTYTSSVGIDSRADDGDYFVIYDFGGFTGGHTEPAGWDFLAQNSGPVPLGTLPQDDPNIPNLVWTWTGPSIIGESPLGEFSAVSTFNRLGFDSFAALSTRSTGVDIGSDISNVGFISVPLVPEPGTVAVLAIGTIGLMVRRTR